jgi:hypothetical protein
MFTLINMYQVHVDYRQLLIAFNGTLMGSWDTPRLGAINLWSLDNRRVLDGTHILHQAIILVQNNRSLSIEGKITHEIGFCNPNKA